MEAQTATETILVAYGIKSLARKQGLSSSQILDPYH
jgi:hypothetical protein